MVESHTIDATTAERKQSELARFGNRYYPTDPSYDKRVYENTCGNYLLILVVFLVFWTTTALIWWGILSFGIVDSEIFGYFSVGAFGFSVSFITYQLISGKYANKLKRQHEFYVEKLAEKRAEEQERTTKLEQERAHEMKLKKLAERLHQA